MKNWESVKLGDLYEVHNGLSKGGKFFGSGYPFLTFSTVFNNYFLPEELTDFVQSTEKERESYSILRGDVFVTRTSETSDELGMSCVALKDYPNATYNGFTKRMRPNTDRVLPEYIGYYMRMPSFRGEFQAFSTMTTRASLKNEDLLSLEVKLPEIGEQKKIAEILSAYDALILNNQKQIKLLEEAAQRLYKEWFVDLRFPGHEDVETVDGIPKGWREQPIDDVFSIKYGKTLPTSKISSVGKYPVYGANGIIGYYSEKNCDDYKVLITSRGNGSGDVLRTYDRESFVTNNSFVVTPVDEDMPFVFIHQLMKATDFKTICTGSAQPQLTNNSISTLQMVVPTKTIVCQYGEMTAPMYKKIETINYQIRNLSEARDRLLPKLMSGEIEVGHDESEC